MRQRRWGERPANHLFELRTEQFDDRRKGQRPVLFIAIALPYQSAEPGCNRPRFAHEARFADSRLAGDEHRSACSAHCLFNVVPQLRNGVIATCEDWREKGSGRFLCDARMIRQIKAARRRVLSSRGVLVAMADREQRIAVCKRCRRRACPAQLLS